jgi:NADP-dependent 3-hydroxy acid dehydrogenase YdfG
MHMTTSSDGVAVRLITGASSGLGFALAECVLANGQRVALTAPDIDPMGVLVDRHP